MKSVVVEASTVAKAIQAAWLKAERPEEFFVRVLQEHQTGFLGFGAQKAKIVLFFKNSQKSDSLFPVVVKQKEYSNFFDNPHLKVPQQLDVIDTELNKHVSLGSNLHKKNHPNNNKQKNQQHQNKQNAPAHNQPAQHKQVQDHTIVVNMNKAAQHPEKQMHDVKKESGQKQPVVHVHKHQNNQQHANKPASSQQPQQKEKPTQTHQEKVHDKPAHQQVKPQNNNHKVPVENQSNDKKDAVIGNVAQVLKKVQSQKIIANVSRPMQQIHKQNQQNNVSAEKEVVVEKPVTQTAQAPEQIQNPAPRIIQKMKRRPLSTDNQGVSGITKSVKPNVPQVTQQESSEQPESFDAGLAHKKNIE